jgi:predicted ATPase/DNA-binding NarL/FixJ family response regulator
VKVAGGLVQAFPDGVFIADLSGVSSTGAGDAGGVARAVAAAVGLPLAERQQDPSGWVASQLRGKRLLLILDTCEHVIEAGAALADAILRGGGPVLLVTSRQPLDLPGEVVFRISPLAVADDSSAADDAIRLFADRAAAAVPGFEITDDTLPTVARLCRLLDGIPFAIELAAIRLRALGLDELLTRLPGHLRLLGSGRRAVAAGRQQSLLTSVAWSYDLCTAQERLLWSRLSVFEGGFDLAAAEAVCAGGELGADAILDTLVGLVDKSVVLRAADSGTVARYQLLAVVKEHGAARGAAPDASAEADQQAGRQDGPEAGPLAYREHYLGVARAFASSFVGPGQLGHVSAMNADAGNLTAAFDATAATGDAAATLEFAVACWPWLVCTGRLAEAGTWLARALRAAPDSASTVSASTVSASTVSASTGPGDGRTARLRQFATRLTAWGLAAQGDLQAADALRASLPVPAQPARPGTGLAGPALAGARPAGPGLAATGDGGATSALMFLVARLEAAFASLRRGTYPDCAARCDELAAGLPAGERWARGWAAWIKGLAGWFSGDRVVAGVRLRAGLELLAPFGGEREIALHLDAFAWLAAGRGDYRRTARLHGAADRIWLRLAARDGIAAPRYGLPLLDGERERAERQAAESLGEAGYAAEHAAGAALSIESAIRAAMPGAPAAPAVRASAISGPGEPRRPAQAGGSPGQALVPRGGGFADQPTARSAGGPTSQEPGDRVHADPDTAFAGRWELLTAREREVAGLVAMGLTNKDIAGRLFVSKRTVDAHLEHILSKLGYNSRVQVAALASHERDREHRERERREHGDAGGAHQPGRAAPAAPDERPPRRDRQPDGEWPIPSQRPSRDPGRRPADGPGQGPGTPGAGGGGAGPGGTGPQTRWPQNAAVPGGTSVRNG